jgi:ligand-binding sensor domain-containing protein
MFKNKKNDQKRHISSIRFFPAKTLSLYSTFLFISLLITSVMPRSPDYKFEQISLEQGLSQSWITTIIQDTVGFLWISTHDGLNMFDGYNFKVYRHDPLDSTSLSGNWITNIHTDRQGRLWIILGVGGLSIFDPASQHFLYHSLSSEKKASVNAKLVQTFYEDRSGTIWLGTRAGGLIRVIFPEDTGEAVSTSPSQYQLERFLPNPDNPSSISDSSISKIYQDRTGSLWVGTQNGGLNLLVESGNSKNSPNDIEFKTFRYESGEKSGISDNHITEIYEDRDGGLWIGTRSGGVNKMVQSPDSSISFIHLKKENGYLKDNSVTDIYQDQSGILWIGTVNSGLQAFLKNQEATTQTSTFNHIENRYLIKNYLCNQKSPTSRGRRIRKIYEDSYADIWVLTDEKGVFRYDREQDRFRLYLTDPPGTSSQKEDLVTTLYEDHSQNLWIGTSHSGLRKLSRNEPYFRHYKHNPNDSHSLSHDYINDFYRDRSGNLWIATRNGLNIFHREKNRFERFFADGKENRFPGDSQINTIHQSRSENNIYWIGTTKSGLVRWNFTENSFKQFMNDPKDSRSLSHNWVWTIYEDSIGNLWIGTLGGGLNKFDPQTELFTRYSVGEPPGGSSSKYVWTFYASRRVKYIQSENRSLYPFF